MAAETEEHEDEITPLFDFGNKLKRWKLYQPPIGVLGIFLLLLSVILCFFYVDYREVVNGEMYNRVPKWLQFGRNERKRVDFLTEEGNGCDVFDGEWVWDEDYPLYLSKDCHLLDPDPGFKCRENGRPDVFYTKWRWQPEQCNLPRFDGKLMLEKLRNKRMVFAGDSIGRNQWESMMCMLASAVANKSSVYEVNGNPISKHQGCLVFKFADYNCTVEYYRSTFLVQQGRPPSGRPRPSSKVHMTLKLDQMDVYSPAWRSADVLVLNSGHWWSYEKTMRWGTYFQVGQEVKMDMEVQEAYRKSMETVMQWIMNEVNTSKTQIFFRTYAPVHFTGGDWNKGGTCHKERLPELAPSLPPLHPWTQTQFELAADEILPSSSSRTVTDHRDQFFRLLNITEMTARRKDGHISIYSHTSLPVFQRRQDCSHWCLPGVPDSWNELLYALLLKREATTNPPTTLFNSPSSNIPRRRHAKKID